MDQKEWPLVVHAIERITDASTEDRLSALPKLLSYVTRFTLPDTVDLYWTGVSEYLCCADARCAAIAKLVCTTLEQSRPPGSLSGPGPENNRIVCGFQTGTDIGNRVALFYIAVAAIGNIARYHIIPTINIYTSHQVRDPSWGMYMPPDVIARLMRVRCMLFYDILEGVAAYFNAMVSELDRGTDEVNYVRTPVVRAKTHRKRTVFCPGSFAQHVFTEILYTMLAIIRIDHVRLVNAIGIHHNTTVPGQIESHLPDEALKIPQTLRAMVSSANGFLKDVHFTGKSSTALNAAKGNLRHIANQMKRPDPTD